MDLNQSFVVGQNPLLVEYYGIPMLLTNVALIGLGQRPLHASVLLEKFVLLRLVIFDPLVENELGVIDNPRNY